MAQTASKLFGLMPAVLCERERDMSDCVQQCKDDMPSPELFDQEMGRWKMKYLSKQVSNRPSSCASAIKQCDKDSYHNIFVLLQIACTLPVTSCECERNASTSCRLRNFMRASMSKDRLTSMHIHYKLDVNLDSVVDIFSHLHPRRLQLSSVLLDTYQ